MEGKFISYLRVSTDDQSRSGLGIEAQREAVTRYLNGGQWQLLEEIVETESGKRDDRPALGRALALCQIHKATLVIAKLDRLSRDVHFITGLMKAGIDFVACDMPAANKMVLQFMAVVAEGERDMISQRTKAALTALKARGVRLGRPNVSKDEWSQIAAKGRERSILVRQQQAAERKRLREQAQLAVS